MLNTMNTHWFTFSSCTSIFEKIQIRRDKRFNLQFTSILLMIFLLFASAQSTKKNEIYGNWKLISGKHNELPAPQVFSERIMSFKSDKTFASRFKSPHGMVQYNGGIFYLINDTTMITYHKDLQGNLETIANTYTINIKNDSLHFHGYYLRQLPQDPSMLIKIYIDEWWVKTDLN